MATGPGAGAGFRDEMVSLGPMLHFPSPPLTQAEVTQPAGPSPVPARSMEERQLSQWGTEETRDLIQLRGELEVDFVQMRGNSRTMWEIIANQMKERGYRRTPAQCRTKWRGLVDRYKGKELSDNGRKRSAPFYEELDAIFKTRTKSMGRLLLESELGNMEVGEGGVMGVPLQLKKKPLKRSHLDDDHTEEEGEQDDPEERAREAARKAASRKEAKERKAATTIQDVLDLFSEQQGKLEHEWRESIERREAERRGRDQEWRDRIEAAEKERIARELAWWQQEEQRREREEARAERKDQLVAAFLARLG